MAGGGGGPELHLAGVPHAVENEVLNKLSNSVSRFAKAAPGAPVAVSVASSPARTALVVGLRALKTVA